MEDEPLYFVNKLLLIKKKKVVDNLNCPANLYLIFSLDKETFTLDKLDLPNINYLSNTRDKKKRKEKRDYI